MARFLFPGAKRGTLQVVTSEPMNFDTRMALCLLKQLIAALRANDPDLFKRWLIGGVQDLGKPAVEKLLLDWLDPFLTEREKDRLIAWHLGVSL